MLVTPYREPLIGDSGEHRPQLSGHNDSHAVAYCLRLLHIVRGNDGSSLTVLEGSTEGSPAGTHTGSNALLRGASQISQFKVT